MVNNLIGIIGISGKMGNFASFLLKDYDEVIGFDKIRHNYFETFDNIDDFLQNGVEVVVDFSNSKLSEHILVECINRGIKIISGTSNIPNIQYIKNLAYEKSVSFVYLENFSKGINKIVEIIDKLNCENVEIIEEHYYRKKDISQTAISLAKILNTNNEISSIRSLKRESNHYFKFYEENEEIILIHKCLNTNAYKEILLREYINIISNDFYFKYGIIDNKKS